MMQVNPEKVIALSTGHKLYFGSRALRLFEIETGESIATAFQGGEVRYSSFVVMLKCGLLQLQPQTTIDEVDLIIDEIGIQDIAELLQQAIVKALPQATASGNHTAALADGENR